MFDFTPAQTIVISTLVAVSIVALGWVAGMIMAEPQVTVLTYAEFLRQY